MSKNILKAIKKMVEDNGTDKVVLFTEHLKIDGRIYIPDGRCDECADEFMPLENAMVCRLNDYCTCEDDKCECDDYVCFKYEWLSVAIKDIVAFSVVQY